MAVSMTGFGSSEVQWESWSCQTEIRSVNQRFLDVRLRLPSGFRKLEAELKKQIKTVCARGKIECSVKLEQVAEEEQLQLNPERARRYHELLTEFETLSGRKVIVQARDLMSVEIIEENRNSEFPEESEDLIRRCLAQALEGLQQMKMSEGQATQEDIQNRLVSCAQILKMIEKNSQAEPGLYRERLQERLSQLNKNLEMNPERLEQEIVLLADRLDISEEVVRFRTHLDHLEEILSHQEVGKKAEFLMQELNREVNTMASKSNHAGISQASVQIRSELEKIREQLANIE